MWVEERMGKEGVGRASDEAWEKGERWRGGAGRLITVLRLQHAPGVTLPPDTPRWPLDLNLVLMCSPRHVMRIQKPHLTN